MPQGLPFLKNANWDRVLASEPTGRCELWQIHFSTLISNVSVTLLLIDHSYNVVLTNQNQAFKYAISTLSAPSDSCYFIILKDAGSYSHRTVPEIHVEMENGIWIGCRRVCVWISCSLWTVLKAHLRCSRRKSVCRYLDLSLSVSHPRFVDMVSFFEWDIF